jgi:hypothetical protein
MAFVLDHEKVLNIKGDMIEKIDVLSKEYYFRHAGGVIDITTYDGDLSDIEFDKPVLDRRLKRHNQIIISLRLTIPTYGRDLIPDYRTRSIGVLM